MADYDVALISSSAHPHPAALRIQLLGGVRLIVDSASTRTVAQPRRLALLALIADAGEAGVTRDRVLGLLWPETSESRARHSLDQLLYALRGDLGHEIVISGNSLALSSSAVTCDVWDFEAAIRSEDWSKAVTIYKGPFLDGFFAGAGEEFDHWADARRTALHREWLHAMERLALSADADADLEAAVRIWTRLATDDPLNSRYALSLMKALANTGDSVGALRYASVHAALAQEEIGAPPDATVLQYAEELRANPAAHIAPTSSPLPRPIIEHAPASVAAPGSRLRMRARYYAVLTAVVAVLGIVAGWWSLHRRDAGARGVIPSVRSLAVLPFEDFSTPQQQYLGDALTDELINQLGKVSGLDVVARTSAFTLKGKSVAVDEIGRRLGVAHVLEGSVKHAGGRLRVSARLVAANSGYQLWAETYDLPAPDVFEVQTRIAHAIAGVLKVTLTSGGSAPPTRNVEAYGLYLRGRTLYLNAGVRDEESTRRALDYLTRAATLDPRFAAAHAGLADVYSRLGDVKRAREAAVEALRLDSTLAEAHASLAYALAYHERNWRDGFREINRAINLNPGYAPAFLRRSNMLAARGEFDAALADVKRALHLDPLSEPALMNEALVLFWAGRYADALPRMQSLVATDSGNSVMRFALGLTYSGLGRGADAAAEFRSLGYTAWEVLADGDRVRVDSLRGALETQLDEDDGTGLKPAAQNYPALAAAYAQLGMDDNAVANLKQIVSPPRSANVAFLIWWPHFRRLHSHPEFERIRRSLFPK